MTEPPETPSTPPAVRLEAAPTREPSAKSERAARLAKALRENLRRRKAPKPARPTDS